MNVASVGIEQTGLSNEQFVDDQLTNICLLEHALYIDVYILKLPRALNSFILKIVASAVFRSAPLFHSHNHLTVAST